MPYPGSAWLPGVPADCFSKLKQSETKRTHLNVIGPHCVGSRDAQEVVVPAEAGLAAELRHELEPFFELRDDGEQDMMC
jgi:hypothetical protein